MCVFQERLLLINNPRNFVSFTVLNLFIFVCNLYVRGASTFISKLNKIGFVKVQKKANLN